MKQATARWAVCLESDALREETDAVHHQERSRAILGFNIEVSDKRTERLREIAADLSR